MIRTAKESDIKEWSRMRTLLWPDTPDRHIGEIEEYFRGESPDITETLLVENKGHLVGFLEINLRSYAEGSREKGVPFIEAWYVDAEHRKRGYGKSLINAAEDWAVKQGYHELASDTEIDNLDGQSAHLALGFKEVERVVCYLKKLM